MKKISSLSLKEDHLLSHSKQVVILMELQLTVYRFKSHFDVCLSSPLLALHQHSHIGLSPSPKFIKICSNYFISHPKLPIRRAMKEGND